MSPTNVNSIEQTAGVISGSGKMTAIAAENINGNVYVERLSQVLIVSLSTEGRAANAERFIDVTTRPYKFLYPYTATDEALFNGRTKEIEIIRKRMAEQRVLVVYGQARMGKTSLLAAGVMPAMAREDAFTLLIEDYKEPEKTILLGLSDTVNAAAVNATAANRFSFDSEQTSSLPLLLDSIIKQSKKTLLLVLDQFEILFEPSITPDERKVFLDNLAEALRTIDEEKLRVIIVARSEALEKLGELEGPLRNLLQCPFQVMPLNLEQARSAIEDPLYKVKPETRTIYDGDIVSTHLLPELDELSPDEPGFIYPQHLQTICAQLYLSAYRKKGDARVIDKELYVDELEGADSIMASFMRSMLKAQVAENQEGLAVRLLAVMAVPGAERWMKPAEFDLQDADPTEIEALLERLVNAKFLIRSYDGDEKKYALVSQMITTELRRLSGTGKEVDLRYNAEDELERVWHTWLSLDHLASRQQIRYLAESGGHLKPRAIKTLLLLRSAVDQDEQAQTWIERLRGSPGEDPETKDGEGRELIKQLEMPEKTPADQRLAGTMLVKAKRLLGFPKEKSAETPEPGPMTLPSPNAAPATSFGPLAEKAVFASVANVRQTCALALAAADPELAIKHLEAALKTVGGRWQRCRRRAELRGALADADFQIAQLNSDLSPLQRLFIWYWRARRRISRDSQRLAWLTLGGAVGAGVGVGLLRALLAVKPEQSGQEFGIYFFLAGTLGGALACGLALAASLYPPPEKRSDNQIPPSYSPLKSAVIRILLGTIFFGLVHSLLALLNGAPPTNKDSYYIVLMAFAVGFGLSVALSLPIKAGKGSMVLRWTASLVIAALTFVLVDQFFSMISPWTSRQVVMMTQITRSRRALGFVSNPVLEIPLWLQLFKTYSTNPQTLATLHAILTGLFMITGLQLGLRQANISLNKKQIKTNRL